MLLLLQCEFPSLVSQRDFCVVMSLHGSRDRPGWGNQGVKRRHTDQSWNWVIWDLRWRSLRIPHSVYCIQLNRGAGLLHTTEQEGEVLYTAEQGGRVLYTAEQGGRGIIYS